MCICRKIQIAICDDEKTVCSDLEVRLLNMAVILNIEIEIDIWYSGEDLCEYLKHDNHIDIIFLDIGLVQLSGIDVGHYIREELEDIKTQIIYISLKQNYAMQLFDTQPFDFLVKPIVEEELLVVMKRLQKIIISQKRFFEYQIGREICRMEYNDILYFKSEARKIVIVSVHEEIEFYGKLIDIIDKAPPQFLNIHKSYLVNRNFIKRYTFHLIEMMNKQELTISKSYQKEVRQKISKPREEIF